MKNNTRNLTVLILLLTLLTACQPTLDVTLASVQEKLPSPRFTVADRRTPGARPLYNTIKLTDAAGELYWHLRAEPFGVSSSVGSFSYAEAIPGFAVVVAPKPLEPNREYILGVIGEAFGTLRFRVAAAGQVEAVEQ
jgi:hypothetical protein